MFLFFLFTLFFSSSSSFTVFVPVGFHKVSGSYVHVCPRPCSSTCRWDKASHPPTLGTTPSMVRALHAHFGRVTTTCVSSRLGCLHWLACRSTTQSCREYTVFTGEPSVGCSGFRTNGTIREEGLVKDTKRDQSDEKMPMMMTPTDLQLNSSN